EQPYKAVGNLDGAGVANAVPDFHTTVGDFVENICNASERHDRIFITPGDQRRNADFRQAIRDVELGHVVHCTQIESFAPTHSTLYQLLHICFRWEDGECAQDELADAFGIALLGVDPGSNVRRDTCAKGGHGV